MCWLNNMATPIVLKKPLKVYTEIVHTTNIGISPEFDRYNPNVGYFGARSFLYT